MSFYQEYLQQMGSERLMLEHTNIRKAYDIASNGRSFQDVERLTWKLQDIAQEAKRRGINL